MTAQNFIPPDKKELLSSPSMPKSDSSQMKEATLSFLGGLSGLLFTLSLIFFLQSPAISLGILAALLTAWGGQAIKLSKSSQ